jgi:hypothetical protein
METIVVALLTALFTAGFGLVTGVQVHQSCGRTDLSTTITAFKSWIAWERSLRFKVQGDTWIQWT